MARALYKKQENLLDQYKYISKVDDLPSEVWNELKTIYADLELGTYHHHAGSLHLYETHYDMANKILDSDDEKFNDYSDNKFTLKPHITLDYIQQKELYLPEIDMTKKEIGEYALRTSEKLFI